MKKHNDKERKSLSMGITLLLHGSALILLLIVGLPYQDPPPAEIGVEMSQNALTESTDELQGIQGGGLTSDERMAASNDHQESSVTQSSEDVPLTARKTKKNIKKQSNQEEEIIDQTALFSKGKIKEKGSGNGAEGGEGSSKGTGNGTGEYGGGTVNSGTSFSLNGRGAKSLSTPKTNRTETGKVVVAIKVDQQGNVIEAIGGEPGTTIMNTNIWRTCEQAAKRSKFSAKESAPEVQKGTITYKFVR
ncbi:MAG: hypothetical protein ACTTJH_00430 [Bacteroidales bacterium]